MWAPTPSFLALLLPAELRQLLLPTPPPGLGCWALTGSSERGPRAGRLLVQKAAPSALCSTSFLGLTVGGELAMPRGSQGLQAQPEETGPRGRPGEGPFAMSCAPCRRSACLAPRVPAALPCRL